MAEFAIVAMPVLALGLGSLELSHWLYTRQAISLALLEAGRAGITDHNRPQRIIAAFEAGLKPLYAGAAPGDSAVAISRALEQRRLRTAGAPWQIQILSPSASAYADFSDPKLRVAGADSRPTINNHYLAEQHLRNKVRGWSAGRGPVSGQTVYEANSLVMRLTWLHQPRLPLMAPLLRALGDPTGSYRQRAFAHGYLPMQRQITLVMQSHPVSWPSDVTGKVLLPPFGEVAPECREWLCSGSGINAGTDVTPLPELETLPPSDNDSAGMPGDNRGPDTSMPWAPPGQDQGEPLVDDPACGVTLCCV